MIIRAQTLVLTLALACTLQSACAFWKPVARTAADAARVLCEVWASEQPGEQLGMSVQDFCQVESNLRPFIDAALSAKREAGTTVGMRNGFSPQP